MDRSLIIFIAIGVGAVYFVTNFIGDIQSKDDTYSNNEYKKEQFYDKYNSVDIIGQKILDVSTANKEIQIKVWNHSSLKAEFLDLFPNFKEMRKFIDDRVRGEFLQVRLKSHLKDVENKFFSGQINAEKAKKMLGLLQ
jgi:hypothetical protein